MRATDYQNAIKEAFEQTRKTTYTGEEVEKIDDVITRLMDELWHYMPEETFSKSNVIAKADDILKLINNK